MYMNTSVSVEKWSEDGREFSLIIDENPFTEFLSLPEKLVKENLLYCNLFCGIIRGALEVLHMNVEVFLVHRNDPQTEIRVKFCKFLEEDIPLSNI